MRGDVAIGRDEPACAAVVDDFRHGADGETNDGDAGGEGFHGDERTCFRRQRRKQEAGRALQQALLFVPSDRTEKAGAG